MSPFIQWLLDMTAGAPLPFVAAVVVLGLSTTFLFQVSNLFKTATAFG